MSTQTLETSARSVSARLGVLGRADGSCQWSQGNTSVLVAVWGPTAPKRAAQALPDRAFVDIRVIEDINDNANQNSNLDGRDNPVSLKTDIYSSFKSIILDTLHPRCQISIVIQVICDDGSLLSACINATTMALIDAGVSVSGFVSSTTIACPEVPSQDGSGMKVDAKDSEKNLLLDPNDEQSRSSGATLTIAYDQRGKQVFSDYKLKYDPSASVDADAQEEQYWSAVSLAKTASAKILNFQRQTIQQKVIYESAASS